MKLTERNVWYHAKFYGVPSFLNGQDGTIIAKTLAWDLLLNVMFSIDQFLYWAFDLSFMCKEGQFLATVIDKEVTDKDWATIQKVIV